MVFVVWGGKLMMARHHVRREVVGKKSGRPVEEWSGRTIGRILVEV